MTKRARTVVYSLRGSGTAPLCVMCRPMEASLRKMMFRLGPRRKCLLRFVWYLEGFAIHFRVTLARRARIDLLYSANKTLLTRRGARSTCRKEVSLCVALRGA